MSRVSCRSLHVRSRVLCANADSDRVVNIVDSAHELWSLPLQILVALCLLYTQVG